MPDQPERQPLAGAAWRKAVAKALAGHARDQRNKRGKRPEPPVTGVRKAT